MMSRFCRYIEKVFDFSSAVATARDRRPRPQIPCSGTWTSGFVMLTTRLGSLNAIESELRVPKRLDALVGSRKPSADTIGRVFALMESDPLRMMLAGINHKLKRNKALPARWPMRFAAVDGHELFSR